MEMNHPPDCNPLMVSARVIPRITKLVGCTYQSMGMDVMQEAAADPHFFPFQSIVEVADQVGVEGLGIADTGSQKLIQRRDLEFLV